MCECVRMADGPEIDYFHLTKAFGAVAGANLPLHFALAVKRSPLRWLFGLSYEGHANFLHRWLGRLVNVLLYAHAALYLAFFWRTDRMSTRFLEPDVLAGFFAVCVLVRPSESGRAKCRTDGSSCA